jgi:hypothetical protein
MKVKEGKNGEIKVPKNVYLESGFKRTDEASVKMSKGKIVLEKKQKPEFEKANYAISRANTLLLTGSIFILAVVAALDFNIKENPQLEYIQYFLMGMSVAGLSSLYVGVKELFRSVHYRSEYKNWVDIPYADPLGILLLTGIWLNMAYSLLPNYGANLVPLVIGVVFSVLLIYIPKNEVGSKKGRGNGGSE